MNFTSLGYQTDLIFARFDGVLTERNGYLVVATPANPTFHWGNFLLFPTPPKAGDEERWPLLFHREFAHDTRVRHLALGWEATRDPLAEAQPFLKKGYEQNISIVLSTNAVQAPEKYNSEIKVRPLHTAAEWQSALELQILVREPTFALESYSLFKREQMARYQKMSKAGLGHWFGAFLGSKLVGDLGLFVEKGIGRFQNVSTHPDFRRQGICGTLVHAAAVYALCNMRAKTLVMVADEAYHAAKIYESVGFKPTERQAGVCLRASAPPAEEFIPGATP